MGSRYGVKREPAKNTNVRPNGAYRHKLTGYRDVNLNKALHNPNEDWMWRKLLETPYFWQRQGLWAYRMFDFWCPDLGIAIEADGPEHDPVREALRDAFALRKAGIVVLRVRNRNEDDAAKAIANLTAERPSYAERQSVIRRQGPLERGQLKVKARNDYRHLPEPPVWDAMQRAMVVPSTGQVIRRYPMKPVREPKRKSEYAPVVKDLDSAIDESEIPW